MKYLILISLVAIGTTAHAISGGGSTGPRPEARGIAGDVVRFVGLTPDGHIMFDLGTGAGGAGGGVGPRPSINRFEVLPVEFTSEQRPYLEAIQQSSENGEWVVVDDRQGGGGIGSTPSSEH